MSITSVRWRPVPRAQGSLGKEEEEQGSWSRCAFILGLCKAQIGRHRTAPPMAEGEQPLGVSRASRQPGRHVPCTLCAACPKCGPCSAQPSVPLPGKNRLSTTLLRRFPLALSTAPAGTKNTPSNTSPRRSVCAVQTRMIDRTCLRPGHSVKDLGRREERQAM